MSKLLFLIVSFAIIFAVSHGAARNPRCIQEIVSGNCMAYFPRYAYDPSLDKCIGFIYGGCGGNDNRFPSMEICEAACIS